MSRSFAGGRRVLIVDDDAGIRLLLVTFLKRHGFQVRQARNGREALDEMNAGQPDLGAFTKDRFEDWLHREVCAGSMGLRAAQQQIAANWQALYRRVFGTTP